MLRPRRTRPCTMRRRATTRSAAPSERTHTTSYANVCEDQLARRTPSTERPTTSHLTVLSPPRSPTTSPTSWYDCFGHYPGSTSSGASVTSTRKTLTGRTAYYRCQGHRRNGHKEGCPNARHYRAIELEEQVWRYVHGILTDPDRLRRVLDAMIEEKRKGLRGDPGKEANVWLDKIADVDRQRVRAQDLAIEGLLSPDELRAKLAALEETRK